MWKKNKQTDAQTDRQMQLKTRPPVTTVGMDNNYNNPQQCNSIEDLTE